MVPTPNRYCNTEIVHNCYLFIAENTYTLLQINDCIVLYCIMRPYTDGPIGPLSYRNSSGVVRNPYSALAE